jgi:hypothetical protein
MLIFLLFLSVAAQVYIPTPAGWVLSHCNHEVESGASLFHLEEGGLLVTNPDGTTWTIPPCDTFNNTFRVLKRREEGMREREAPAPGAPEVYDGWTAYVEYDIPSPGFDSFTGVMNVVDEPTAEPQVLYIFPGLQNIDWIPVVDPDPSGPFDIIQPVIQYPGDSGRYWSVKSWYVTLDVGTVHSRELRLDVGDSVFGNMTRTGATSWFIGSQSRATKNETNINVNNARLQTQPWAYNTIECYGCNGCNTYPKNPEKFTELQLTQNGKTIPATWRVNPKPSKMMQCKEKPAVVNSGEVDVSFQ